VLFFVEKRFFQNICFSVIFFRNNNLWLTGTGGGGTPYTGKLRPKGVPFCAQVMGKGFLIQTAWRYGKWVLFQAESSVKRVPFQGKIYVKVCQFSNLVCERVPIFQNLVCERVPIFQNLACERVRDLDLGRSIPV